LVFTASLIRPQPRNPSGDRLIWAPSAPSGTTARRATPPRSPPPPPASSAPFASARGFAHCYPLQWFRRGRRRDAAPAALPSGPLRQIRFLHELCSTASFPAIAGRQRSCNPNALDLKPCDIVVVLVY
jgi:hypothetical protein